MRKARMTGRVQQAYHRRAVKSGRSRTQRAEGFRRLMAANRLAMELSQEPRNRPTEA